jgi:hypothetical protein
VPEYTIGTGQTFNTTRPVTITAAYIRRGDVDYQLDLIDGVSYAHLFDKTETGIGEALYYDANYPTAKIRFWPVPDAGDTLTLHTRKALTQFSSLDTTFTMPPEYLSFLKYNAAVWIAPEYEFEPAPNLLRLANLTKQAVINQNAKNEAITSQIDGFGTGGYSTDEIAAGAMYT